MLVALKYSNIGGAEIYKCWWRWNIQILVVLEYSNIGGAGIFKYWWRWNIQMLVALEYSNVAGAGIFKCWWRWNIQMLVAPKVEASLSYWPPPPALNTTSPSKLSTTQSFLFKFNLQLPGRSRFNQTGVFLHWCWGSRWCWWSEATRNASSWILNTLFQQPASRSNANWRRIRIN